MADIYTRSQHIDLTSKFIVNGFIRESEELLPFENNPYYHVNELVAQVCLVYYAIVEYWDNLSPIFTAQNDRTVMKRSYVKGTCGDWSDAGYGKQCIPSKGNLIYEWYVKMTGVRRSRFKIGICDSKYHRTDNAFGDDGIANYCYENNGKLTGLEDGECFRFSERPCFGRGDLISLRLDTKKGEMQFYLQSRLNLILNKPKKLCPPFRILHRDDLSYKLAASIYYNNDCMNIEKFEITKA